MQQHGVTRPQRMDPSQQVRGGQPPHGDGRCGVEGDTVRQTDEMFGGHDAFGAVGAQRAARIGDAIAHAEIRYAGPGGFDDTGGLHTHAGG